MKILRFKISGSFSIRGVVYYLCDALLGPLDPAVFL